MKKSLLYIGNRLVNKGFPATTIDTLGPLLESEGVEVRYASAYKNKLLRMSHMLFSVILFGKKVDYVLIDTYSTQNFWYAFAIAKTCGLLNIKYIPILHGGGLPERLKSSPKSSKTLFAKAYRNVAPSQFLLDTFRAEGFDNLIYIPNNLNMGDYSYKKRDFIEPKLLWVRSFAAIYNPLLAVLVMEQLVKKYPEAELCMVGPDKDGSLEACRSYARQHELRVEFTGLLSKREWHTLSADYDLFINTSRYDNLPVSVMEAMALGLPVVSTNVGGIPYLLENKKDALLVNRDDTAGFADAVERLIKNPEIANKLAANARRKVAAFDWEKVKGAWEKLLG